MGVNLPVILTQVDAEETVGFANPMGFVEYRLHPAMNQMLGLDLPIYLGAITLTPELELPVTPDHRVEWTAGLGLKFKL